MEDRSSAQLKPLTSKDYSFFLEILRDTSLHFSQITHFFEQTILPKLPARATFLDIGAGDGILTGRMAPYFSSTATVEPNPLFESTLLSHGYHLHPQLFLEVPFDPQEKHDFILASHVFYHMDQALLEQSVQKAYSMLAPQSSLLIVLRAPSKGKSSLEAEINTHYINSTAIQKLLPQMDIDFKVHSVVNTFESHDSRVIATIMRFFALTDCLPQEELEGLSGDAKIAILQLIEQHVKMCRKGNVYRFEQVEDYITITKPQ